MLVLYLSLIIFYWQFGFILVFINYQIIFYVIILLKDFILHGWVAIFCNIILSIVVIWQNILDISKVLLQLAVFPMYSMPTMDLNFMISYIFDNTFSISQNQFICIIMTMHSIKFLAWKFLMIGQYIIS